MIISEFNIEEQEGKLHVYVEIPHENNRVARFVFDTKDVVNELKRRGVEVGEKVSSTRSTLKNWREHTRSGTWVFEKKSLDKRKKPVIIKVEKEVLAPPKKKRTRSSTKKVSTEG